MTNNELYHFGIRGMKWGVRRYQNRDGKSTSLGKKRKAANEDNKKDDIKNMTDEELRKKVNRLQMERQYSQLTNDTKKVNKGKQFVSKVMKTGATITAATTTAITLYNNAEKVKSIISKKTK